MTGPTLAMSKEVRRWFVVAIFVVALAVAYRIFVTAPREQHGVDQAAGAATERIQEVQAAAGRGDDAAVQRMHADAIERAEKMLEAKP